MIRIVKLIKCFIEFPVRTRCESLLGEFIARWRGNQNDSGAITLQATSDWQI
jgi:hypothetical protein